ncbi:hypothetical protein LPJ54_003867, partial [Coemansia sp. RSA 1824]
LYAARWAGDQSGVGAVPSARVFVPARAHRRRVRRRRRAPLEYCAGGANRHARRPVQARCTFWRLVHVPWPAKPSRERDKAVVLAKRTERRLVAARQVQAADRRPAEPPAYGVFGRRGARRRDERQRAGVGHQARVGRVRPPGVAETGSVRDARL